MGGGKCADRGGEGMRPPLSSPPVLKTCWQRTQSRDGTLSMSAEGGGGSRARAAELGGPRCSSGMGTLEAWGPRCGKRLSLTERRE